MTTTELICWKCGTEIHDVPLPVGRGEECPNCVSSLRACRMCRFYDPNVSNDCREPMADAVSDKEAANTCDYFSPGGGEEAEDAAAAMDARSRLGAVFGDVQKQASGLADEAAAFGEREETEAEEARRRLEEMFGKKDD